MKDKKFTLFISVLVGLIILLILITVFFIGKDSGSVNRSCIEIAEEYRKDDPSFPLAVFIPIWIAVFIPIFARRKDHKELSDDQRKILTSLVIFTVLLVLFTIGLVVFKSYN